MRRTRFGTVGLGVALLAVSLVAQRVDAELLRCKGPDGRMIYTDKASTCPNAKPFEPKGEIQTVPGVGRPPRSAPARASSARTPDTDDGDETRWRTKKREAEGKLNHYVRLENDLKRYVTWCNRGRQLFRKDPTTGLKGKVSCNSVRAELASVEGERTKLRAYLASGLEEECRRAGCLPGWIR